MTAVVQNNREAWLDNVKMVAMILVIAIHTIGHIGDMNTWGYSAVAEWINSFNMQMFTLLAGYTTWHSFKKIDSVDRLCDYGEKIFSRMVLPAVIFSAIPQIEKHLLFARKLWVIFAIVCFLSYWAIKLYKKHPNHILLSSRILLIAFLLVSSLWLNMYWYLAMLMKLQCIGALSIYLSNRLEFSENKPWVHIIALVILLFIPVLLWLDSWTIEMAPFFILGISASVFSVKIKRNYKTLVLSIISIFVGLGLQPVVSGYSFYNTPLSWFVSEGHLVLFCARFICAVVMSIVIIGFVVIFSKTYNLFSRMGSYSLSFYIFQEILLTYLIYPYVNIQGNPVVMWIGWITFVICFVYIIYGIVMIFVKLSLTRIYLLGK